MAVTKQMKIEALDDFCGSFVHCSDCPFDTKFYPEVCADRSWEDMSETALDILIKDSGIKVEEKPLRYWDNICEMQKKQTEKGLRKYGQILEENTEMTIIERLEYLEEELIDGLMYLEHIKEMIKENKEVS